MEEVYAIGEEYIYAVPKTQSISRMSDGSYYVAMYENAVHYLNDDDKWEEIDNTLVSSVAKSSEDITGVSNKQGKLSIKFANNSNSSKLFAIKDGNYQISFHVVNANKSKAASVMNPDTNVDTNATLLEQITTVKKGTSRVIYADILDNVDIEYVVIGNTVKENIIVKEKADSYEYMFDMKLNKLTAEQLDDGIIGSQR